MSSPRRPIAVTTLTVAALAVALVVLGAGGGYTLHARFQDAGQLVAGGQVEVAGRPVGSISGLTVTPNGLAEVTMSIDGGVALPLHRGTRAIIRAVGQAGVDNRFVQLIPGAATAPELPSGSTLPTSQTNGIVDLDAVLDAFDPHTRASLQQLFAHTAQLYAGSGARYFRGMLRGLDPALAQLSGLSGQLAGDRVELASLVRTGALAAGAVASRSTQLEDALGQAATTFTEIASERTQLADLLTRAPAVLRQAGGTLAGVATAVTALRPTLRATVAAAPSIRALLNVLPPSLNTLTPVAAQLSSELGGLRETLAALAPLARPAIAGLRSTATGFTALQPILVGLREYGSDLVLGIFNGLGGLVSGPYAQVGHYAKLNFVQSPQTLFAGSLSSLLSSQALVPGEFSVRTHVAARCPGGDAPPAPDGSSPWVPDKSLCTPADDTPLSVDFPR